MSYEINVQPDPAFESLASVVREAAQATLKHERPPAGALSVILTDEKTLQAANLQFAGIDEPTDVLSFSDGEQMPDAEGIYFGDILIAVPLAEGQARQRDHSLKDELCLLTIHGILHLLGYDHDREADREQMWSRQGEILVELAIHPSVMEPNP